MYLIRPRRSWIAVHDIPADLHAHFGKKRFKQSLETEDKKTALRKATPWQMKWLAEIEQARTNSTEHMDRDALYWRKVLKEAPEAHKPVIRELIADEATLRHEKALAAAGIANHDDPRVDELPGVAEAEHFFAVATGQVVNFDEHLEEYLGLLNNEPKSVDMKRSNLQRFGKDLRFLSSVKRKEVQQWVNRLAKGGKSGATIRRAISDLRGYWAYLQSIELVEESSLPFEKLAVPKPSKNAKADERMPFLPADVVNLRQSALSKGDHKLADLIELAMWTGARLEELCAMKLEKVGPHSFSIEDAKTSAGWREVPIHTKLKATVARLREASKDGYLLSGLTSNKYGDRSNAIGKRFGRLRTDMKFGPQFVFHSIRKTVATLLEDAGVEENIAADILGHDKPTMTYGLYSGGTSLQTKHEALEKIIYPAPTPVTTELPSSSVSTALEELAELGAGVFQLTEDRAIETHHI